MPNGRSLASTGRAHTRSEGRGRGALPPTSSSQTPPRGASPAEQKPAQPQRTRPSRQPKHTITHTSQPSHTNGFPRTPGQGAQGESQPPRAWDNSSKSAQSDPPGSLGTHKRTDRPQNIQRNLQGIVNKVGAFFFINLEFSRCGGNKSHGSFLD